MLQSDGLEGSLDWYPRSYPSLSSESSSFQIHRYLCQFLGPLFFLHSNKNRCHVIATQNTEIVDVDEMLRVIVYHRLSDSKTRKI